MDRKIIYPGAIPLENDLLETNRFAIIGLAKLAGAIMGTSTYLNGLACLPTSPASMAVTVGAGEIYSLQNVDDTAYSSLPADTTHSILKQGILPDATTLALQAPATSGFSQNYLIEVTFEESDTESTVLPYYNASNPTQAWHGPNNSGSAQGTVRQGKCVVNAKAGIAATTGTQTTPGPDAGYIAAYVVTIDAGQTTTTAANITRIDSAPFLPEGGLVDGMQTGAMNYAVDHGATNAYAASFTPPVKALVDGMTLTFRATNANTGASTFSPNGLTAAPLYSNTNTPLTGGEILVSAQVEVIWNSALSAWVLANTNISALSKGFVKTVNEQEPDEHGNVSLTAGDIDALPASALPVGIPFPWPSNTPPAGFVIMQGQTFATAQYPKLTLAYPSGALPDMRGQTIKGKPDGRNPLTREAGEVKSHGHAATVSSTDLGTKNTSSFDYGTKSTTGGGDHEHISGLRTDGGKGGYGDGVVPNGSRVEGTSAQGTASPKTNHVAGHAHSTVLGPHLHSTVIGPHGHTATISPTGNAQNTVDNTAFNYIVRLA